MSEIYQQLSSFDLFVIFANLVLLGFSSKIANRLAPEQDESKRKGRLAPLRIASAVLLVIYILPFTGLLGECSRKENGCPSLTQISLSGLTLLFSYAFYIVSHGWIVRRYGRIRKVEDQEIFSSTYQSELFSLICLILVIMVAFLTVLSIWGVEEWLQSTSVLGGILLVLFFTKDIWLPDMINGLIMLYRKDIEPGSVVCLPEMNFTGIVLRTSLMQTVLRDLTHRHQVIMPNAKIRQARVEVLTRFAGTGLKQTVDFMIGYDVPPQAVVSMLTDAWNRAVEAETAIASESDPKIVLVDNGDHARQWRLFYSVQNIYRLNDARFAINRAACEASITANIGLNTPITHQSLPG